MILVPWLMISVSASPQWSLAEERPDDRDAKKLVGMTAPWTSPPTATTSRNGADRGTAGRLG
jgi:hypothetical protein